MESTNENPKCSGRPADSATAQTSCCELFGSDAPQRFRRKCDGCLLRHCLYPSAQAPAVRRMGRAIKRLEFEPKAALYRDGQSENDLYIIQSGLVKLVQYPRFGSARIVRLLHSGDVTGFEALLGGAYCHRAITLTAAVSCVILRDVVTFLLDLDSGDHPFRRAMMACWQHHLEAADHWLCGFSTGPAEARVARLILFFISIEQSGDPGSEVRLLCREDMASVLGLAYESVCREVSKLRVSGALRQLGAGRYACNTALLEELSNSTHDLC